MILCPACGTVPTPDVAFGYNDGECRCGRLSARGGTNPSNRGCWVLDINSDVRFHFNQKWGGYFNTHHPVLDDAIGSDRASLVMEAIAYEDIKLTLSS